MLILIALELGLLIHQAPTPSPHEREFVLACQQGQRDAREILPDVPGAEEIMARAPEDCERMAQRMRRNGKLEEEENPVALGCGFGVGYMFGAYGLAKELSQPLVLKVSATCSSKVVAQMATVPSLAVELGRAVVGHVRDVLLLVGVARIERVANTVADEVEGEDRHRNEKTGEPDHPRGVEESG